MSLYPSLEDMQMDQMAKAQKQISDEILRAPSAPPTAATPYPLHPQQAGGHAYPALGEYMGMEFSHELLALNMPEYLPNNSQVAPCHPSLPPSLVAPLSSPALPSLAAATPTNAIRQVVLCKDEAGQVGLRLKDVSKGVFVCLVKKDSPAALAGLRFGDQVLSINDTVVAGFSMDKAHALIKRSPPNGITVCVRDRPFERVVTLHKDSSGALGLHLKDGRVHNIVKGGSAARNGVLTDHHVLEVNGQNVVGLKDKEVTAIIADSGPVVTLTLIPHPVFKHMISSMGWSLTKVMDHSLPTI